MNTIMWIGLFSKYCKRPRVVREYGRHRPASHLFGSLPLHLWGAGSWGPENAGSNANGQVEGIHLVIVGVALYAVQHGDQMSQQEQILGGQKRQQPERRWREQVTHLEWKTDCCSCMWAPVWCFFISRRNSLCYFCDKSDTHILQEFECLFKTEGTCL